MSSAGPIGVFDSGIGGLTVLRALRDRLPAASLLYLGDTARLPYGTKSPATVVRYALRAARYLCEHGIGMLVVACNTASATALEELEASLDIPVVGVVWPGARVAAGRTHGRVGVIGTESTVASHAYSQALRRLRAGVVVTERACPLLVPLAEEGWFDHPVTHEVARIYLEPLVAEGIDTLILGCTHYPLLRDAIAAATGAGVALVDSASAVAEVVAELRPPAPDEPSGGGEVRLLVTDAATRFVRIARDILGESAVDLELVDLPD